MAKQRKKRRRISVTGSLVSRWREHRGLSRAAVGDAAGVSASAVGLWESGVIAPEERRLLPLARVFRVTLAEFYAGPPEAHT